MLLDGITKLINNMKNWIKSIGDWIRNTFSNVHDQLEVKGPVAVKAVQKFKESIEEHEGSLQWIVQQTRMDGDDEVLEFVLTKLPSLVKEMAIVDGLASHSDSIDEAWIAYTRYLKSKMKESRVKDWVMLAAQALGMIITRKAPIQVLIIAGQKAFQLLFGKA